MHSLRNVIFDPENFDVNFMVALKASNRVAEPAALTIKICLSVLSLTKKGAIFPSHKSSCGGNCTSLVYERLDCAMHALWSRRTTNRMNRFPPTLHGSVDEGCFMFKVDKILVPMQDRVMTGSFSCHVKITT